LFTGSTGSYAGFGQEFLEAEHVEEIRNPNAEIRKKSKVRMTNDRAALDVLIRNSKFGFLSDFGIRTSDFTLGFLLGLAQAGNPVASFPLIALFEQLDPFKAFQNISFTAQSGCGPKTTML
jgi:hypothetical protein